MTASIPSHLPVAARAAALALLLGCAGAAMAQYKIVGPDGSVTYTDKPPTAAQMRGANGTATDAGGGGGGAMPYELRQPTARYPVTLYAQKGCGPCDQARQALKARGIPFNEYSIETTADVAQFKQRFNDGSMPVVTIGTQAVKGFLKSDLDAYLDAAGYPKQSRLAGYSWPAPVPLAPIAPTAHPAPATTAPASPSGPKIELPPPSKNGIQF